MKKNNLKLTVGITTCYGDESILDTVKSIRAQKGIGNIDFIIVADRVPIKPHIKKELKKFNVRLIENRESGSQIKKQKQIIEATKTEIIILTQDDVLYEPSAFLAIFEAFKNDPDLTMLSVRNQPVAPLSLFEDVINVGTGIANNMAKFWKDGDNYLANVGRCMVFRTNFLKQNLHVPDKVATTDAYYYFLNKFTGGKFKYLYDVAVYFRNPQNMKEHLRKSSRFQFSELEMSQYFSHLKSEYKIPTGVLFSAVLNEFIENPIKLTLYLFVKLYTIINRLQPIKVLNPIWEVDLSTKQILRRHT